MPMSSKYTPLPCHLCPRCSNFTIPSKELVGEDVKCSGARGIGSREHGSGDEGLRSFTRQMRSLLGVGSVSIVRYAPRRRAWSLEGICTSRAGTGTEGITGQNRACQCGRTPAGRLRTPNLTRHVTRTGTRLCGRHSSPPPHIPFSFHSPLIVSQVHLVLALYHGHYNRIPYRLTLPRPSRLIRF